MACQEYESSVVPVRHAAVQQVTGCRLLSLGLQESCGPFTAEKAGSNTSQMKNYRTVSNLSFLYKLLERVVQKRLQEFLDSNNLMPVKQSAYHQYHSTDTAVTKVYNDLLLAGG